MHVVPRREIVVRVDDPRHDVEDLGEFAIDWHVLEGFLLGDIHERRVARIDEGRLSCDRDAYDLL